MQDSPPPPSPSWGVRLEDYAFVFTPDGEGGDVEIVAPGGKLSVPASVLKDFLAAWVRRDRIARLGQATTAELLGF